MFSSGCLPTMGLGRQEPEAYLPTCCILLPPKPHLLCATSLVLQGHTHDTHLHVSHAFSEGANRPPTFRLLPDRRERPNHLSQTPTPTIFQAHGAGGPLGPFRPPTDLNSFIGTMPPAPAALAGHSSWLPEGRFLWSQLVGLGLGSPLEGGLVALHRS